MVGCSTDSGDLGQPPSPATATSTGRSSRRRGLDHRRAILPQRQRHADLGSAIDRAITLAAHRRDQRRRRHQRRRPVELVTPRKAAPRAGHSRCRASLPLRVDAIIGPTSSLNTLGTLGEPSMPACLTAARRPTAGRSTTFPDDGSVLPHDPQRLVCRPRPSPSVVEAPGSSTAVVVYLDDGYGRPFARSHRRRDRRVGTEVAVHRVRVHSRQGSISAVQRRCWPPTPEVVAVIADGVIGPGHHRCDRRRGTDPASPTSSTMPFGRPLVGAAVQPRLGACASAASRRSPYADSPVPHRSSPSTQTPSQRSLRRTTRTTA